MCRPCIGHWRGVGGSRRDGHGHRVRVLQLAIGHAESENVDSLDVRSEFGIRGVDENNVRIRQTGPGGHADKRPLEQKRVAVWVAGGRPVELHRVTKNKVLI